MWQSLTCLRESDIFSDGLPARAVTVGKDSDILLVQGWLHRGIIQSLKTTKLLQIIQKCIGIFLYFKVPIML